MVEKSPDLALILAFDVKIVPEASELAKQMGVTIFSADIIYHLFDKVKCNNMHPCNNVHPCNNMYPCNNMHPLY